MPIYDTSNVIDNSMFLKAKLEKNMVGSNYYIDNLQSKRNQDWEYRYNVVGIEEELKKLTEYSDQDEVYTPIDVVITNVKPKNGEDLSTDWASIAFKDLYHPCGIGYRYRFSLDFPNMEQMSEEDKHYDTSVWIAVNKAPIKAGNSCTIRRCNSFLTFLGSPTKTKDYITEIHYEPCVLENERKYMQVYYNETLPVVQAEWYVTMQLNYFTNTIRINDRFIFGTIDSEDESNQQVYKVKALIKSTTDKTFFRSNEEELEHTPLIVIALDRDLISPNDDFKQRIPESAPIYKVEEQTPAYQCYIQVEEPSEQRILLKESSEYTVNLYYNDHVVENIKFEFSAKLNGIIEKNWQNYFRLNQTDINKFSVENLKQCNRGVLVVTAKCSIPTNLRATSDEYIEQSYEIELGGFY